jgi:uncharacterized protein YjbI with pentapeptide repeats
MERRAMSRDDLAKDSLFTSISGPLAPEEITHHFRRRSDLTYRKIEDVRVSGTDLYLSILTGSLIRNSVFEGVKFTRCDLDGVRVEGSTFSNCEFTGSDIRSSVFVDCVFDNCDFHGAYVDDCQVQGGTLASCKFENATLSHCDFRKVSLGSCNVSEASFLHTKLHNCAISDIDVGDCTILYVILRECSLIDITISAECIGGVFGISREQLKMLNISYLGEHEPVPADSDLLRLLYEQYVERKWFIGQLVMNVSFELISTISAFDRYLSLSYARFAEFGFAKGDELEFVGDLLEELAFREKLPLLTALNVLDWCTALESVMKDRGLDSTENSGDPFHSFVSRVALLTNKLLDRLDRAVPEIHIHESDRLLCIAATFEQKPETSLSETLNLINKSSPLGITQTSQLIRVEQGSYVEVILTTLFSIVALQIFLYLINGCVIQLTELKQRLKMLVRKNAPKTYVELALSNTQPGSPLILSLLPALLAQVKGLAWLKEASMGGYVASNIRSLREIEYTSEVPEETPEQSSGPKTVLT